MKRDLSNVTLIGIDCVDIERLKLAANICEREIEFGAVKLLTSLPDQDPRVVQIDPILSVEEYSNFCLKKMNEYVDTKFALIIQYDGFILNPDAWTDDFLKYDYIGASWWYGDDANVGNGGFSLRSKKLLDILATDKNLAPTEHAEDHAIARVYGPYLKSIGITFAPESVADRFSIEGHKKGTKPQTSNTWTDQFGFHGLRKTDISNWLAQHPEYADKIDNAVKLTYVL